MEKLESSPPLLAWPTTSERVFLYEASGESKESAFRFSAFLLASQENKKTHLIFPGILVKPEVPHQWEPLRLQKNGWHSWHSLQVDHSIDAKGARLGPESCGSACCTQQWWRDPLLGKQSADNNSQNSHESKLGPANGMIWKRQQHNTRRS